MRARWLLTVGFAGAVMADPVSSVAYAIESALIRLDGDAAALGVSMTAVVFVIALVAMSYWQIIGLFPDGGGSAEAAGAEFGTRWTFLPLGALVVDFVLTIAISVTAATSALASWIPRVHDWSIPITWGLLVVVALLVASGGRGRLLLAAMTVAFVLASIVVVLAGLPIEAAGQPIKDVAQLRDSGSDLVGIIVAMSAAMALATGIEAPASAIAEVGHLDADGRRRLGRTALVATVVVVGVLTLALTLLVVHQGAGLPPDGQTLLAATVRDALGSGVLLGGFQLTTALLLLAAAGSSLQAGPGLAKALSRAHDGVEVPLLPRWFGRSTRDGVPWIGVAAFSFVAAVLVAVAGANEQTLVVFYAVAVFVGFAFGIAAMLRYNLRRGRRAAASLNALGLVAVVGTLALNVSRIDPIASLAAALVVAAVIDARWRRLGRPEIHRLR